MLDPQLFKSQLDFVTEELARRNFAFDVASYKVLAARRKTAQINSQELQSKRNAESKKIGLLKAKGEDIQPLLAQIEDLGVQLKQANAETADCVTQMNALMEGLPNLLDPEVPAGKSEAQNLQVSTWGVIPKFDFPAQDHVQLGEQLDGMDFALGAKIASARFVVLKGKIARLQRALIQFMLDTHIDVHGYTETYVPFLANAASLRGTGQLPKFAADLFKTTNETDLYLIPTAEVPVTNIVRDVIIDAKTLPLKFVSHTPCFRSEAGAYGQDVRGMIRQHQFEKVELVQIVRAEDSAQAHMQLTAHAETILQKLNLPYRKVLLCAGDTGFSAAKTYDLEVWLPAQDKYREISSCSNFKAFQARRMQARWRNPATGKPELVHTLNGSGLAAGRALIAVMENYQDAEGRIQVPQVLQDYMGGLKIIE